MGFRFQLLIFYYTALTGSFIVAYIDPGSSSLYTHARDHAFCQVFESL